MLTVLIGILGGFVVGPTSVGSGSVIIALLLLVYPTLRPNHLIGTAMVQAIPLVGAATVGHLLFGEVQFALTGSVLVGGIPGVLVGSALSARIPATVIQPAVTALLSAVAVSLIQPAAAAHARGGHRRSERIPPAYRAARGPAHIRTPARRPHPGRRFSP